eukprot:7631503-Ditylum_brightwellii.AAC.1
MEGKKKGGSHLCFCFPELIVTTLAKKMMSMCGVEDSGTSPIVVDIYGWSGGQLESSSYRLPCMKKPMYVEGA